MKRWILILYLLVGSALSVAAQQGLHIAPLFDGQVVERTKMVETHVVGSQLQAYHLSLFRSVRLSANDAERKRIEQMVRADATRAAEKEMEMRSGRLVYALLRLAPLHGQHRYLCLQQSGGSVLVVYMEGSATLPELKNMFTKK